MVKIIPLVTILAPAATIDLAAVIYNVDKVCSVVDSGSRPKISSLYKEKSTSVTN